MSHPRIAPLTLTWCRTLLVAALPLACAVGVKPEFDDNGIDASGGAGTASGGKLAFAGSTSAGTPAKAGSSATSGGSGTGGSGGGAASPFGGTASTGGKGGSAGSGGAAAGAAGTAGAGGATPGAGGAAGAGGVGTGTCACPKKLTWVDNTNLGFGPGDCLEVAGAMYLYTGVKAQTWANKDCNPALQLTWCSDVGADYKFMLCK